jgi:3-oxoacyl-[acyl-carrier protein] reductase
MKTILITGGSRGIGAQLVRTFAYAGWQVAFTYLNSRESAEKLCAETGAHGYLCDARDENAVRETVDKVLSSFRRLDAVIHNAGTAYTGLVQDMPSQVFDDLYQVHVKGAFLLSKYCLPPMISEQKGAVLFISSMWGQVGASCESAYSACKAAVIGFAKALAQEVGPSHVRVNALCPGVIETDMLRQYSQEDKQALADETPLGRLGTPEDVANAALFLCGDGASFITGQVLGVNGGFVIT